MVIRKRTVPSRGMNRVGTMLLLSLKAGATTAVVVPPAQPVLVGPGGSPQPWVVPKDGLLRFLPGARATSIESLGYVTGDEADVEAVGDAVTAKWSGLVELKGSRVTSSGGSGLVALAAGQGVGPISRIYAFDSSIRGHNEGVRIAGGTVFLVGSHVVANGPDSVGALVQHGTLDADGSVVAGSTSGISLVGSGSFERKIEVSRSEIQGGSVAGLQVATKGDPVGDASAVRLLKGTTLSATSGVAVLAQRRADLRLTLSESAAKGDVIAVDQARIKLDIEHNSILAGSARGAIQLTLRSGSTWVVPSASSIDSLRLEHAELKFSGEGHHALKLRGGLTGGGSVIDMRAYLDFGQGSRAAAGDTLHVAGDVDVDSPISLNVNVEGPGGYTDVDGDRRPGPDEGLTLVTVAGRSTADAFILQGGYVAVGPFQYRLDAQSRSGAGDGSDGKQAAWSYRLVSAYVEPEKEPSLPEPAVTVPDEGRPAVVPQIPSYLSLPSAVLLYDTALYDGTFTSGLRRRMGDVVGDVVEGGGRGEVFARQLQTAGTYRSDRGFTGYGYSYRQRYSASQVGATLLTYDVDNGSLRAGWSLDRGQMTITPGAVDGASMTAVRSRGGAAWLTWTSGDGAWLDMLVAHRGHYGIVATSYRGPSVGNVHLSSRAMAFEGGWPAYTGIRWILEPSAGMTYGTQHMRVSQDADGMRFEAASTSVLSASLGLTAVRWANPALAPYASIQVRVSRMNGRTLSTLNEGHAKVDFRAGGPGRQATLAVGIDSRISPRMHVYAEAQREFRLGRAGLLDWSAHVGLRMKWG